MATAQALAGLPRNPNRRRPNPRVPRRRPRRRRIDISASTAFPELRASFQDRAPTMAKSQNQKLVCAQCGYENEPERVYCHNCGTKLDRSVLPRDTQTQQETLAETRRRIRKMTRPGSVRPFVRLCFKTLFWAAIVAAILLIARKPENLPTREQEVGANIISGEI